MDRFDRIFLLHKELVRARVPVSCARLEAALECARATVIRTIADMRDHLGAPIVYDRARNGYLYAKEEGGGRYELPGLCSTPRRPSHCWPVISCCAPCSPVCSTMR